METKRKWSRIDYIGQNGPTGEHYMELFTYCPAKCSTFECEKNYSKAPVETNEPVYWMLDKPLDCTKYVPCSN